MFNAIALACSCFPEKSYWFIRIVLVVSVVLDHWYNLWWTWDSPVQCVESLETSYRTEHRELVCPCMTLCTYLQQLFVVVCIVCLPAHPHLTLYRMGPLLWWQLLRMVTVELLESCWKPKLTSISRLMWVTFIDGVRALTECVYCWWTEIIIGHFESKTFNLCLW